MKPKKAKESLQTRDTFSHRLSNTTLQPVSACLASYSGIDAGGQKGVFYVMSLSLKKTHMCITKVYNGFSHEAKKHPTKANRTELAHLSLLHTQIQTHTPRHTLSKHTRTLENTHTLSHTHSLRYFSAFFLSDCFTSFK